MSLSILQKAAAVDMGMITSQEEVLVKQIWDIYDSISMLASLKPSAEVNRLFSLLVLTCIPANPIDVGELSGEAQAMRAKLIRLCGEAEGLLESHFSALLASHGGNPVEHLALFPYYDNYVKLGLLEYGLLGEHLGGRAPARIAFIGSGPLPLTSIVLAKRHLPSTIFHNYDVDPAANASALRLVRSDPTQWYFFARSATAPNLSGRMFFHTADVMEVTHALRDYDVVFLAALVGLDAAAKGQVVEHLARHMAPGAVLMLRSAHGARAFLYPVVDPGSLHGSFEVLSVFHPTDEVINSVVVARRMSTVSCGQPPAAGGVELQGPDAVVLTCKCSDLPAFNPLGHNGMMEQLTLEEQAS